MIFETERLLVRKLIMGDLEGFHRLESNPNVLKYADGEVKNATECESELQLLIEKYKILNNNFFIYAIERKSDKKFIGTVALIKNDLCDEIGYRIIEDFWSLGYGKEVVKGLLIYCRFLKIEKVIVYAVNKNIASVQILEKLQFKKVATYINKEISFLETKYELEL